MSRPRSWCCSFNVSPSSPDNPIRISKNIRRKPDPFTKPGLYSVPTSPKSGLNFVDRIDPRRILSPGRVSPIDSDPTADPGSYVVPDPIPAPKSRSESFRERNSSNQLGSSQEDGNPLGSDRNGGLGYDVRINVRGRKGGTCLVLEMNSEVLIANSEVFRGLIEEYFKKGKMGNNEKTSCSRICRIEVGDVENLSVFRETIEFMFDGEEEITKRLLKIGAFRAIDILEVSAGIVFKKGVLSCIKYLEAVPWTEEEEEKLRSVVTRFKLDETATRDIIARLILLDSPESQQSLARQLVWLITSCDDSNSRNELKSLVKGLLCKSSIYEKDQPDLSKEDLYAVSQSCLYSLVSLLEEGCATVPSKGAMKTKMQKPLIERLHMQVDNINWLLEILIDQQMGEEFVDIWTNQDELLKLHDKASPMIRYELSRISANLFIAIGLRRLHCRSETRTGLLETWFGPMLLDFGWLRRCRKGLDIRALEEAMGQTLLTLPLKQQYGLFMEWFRCFSKHGTECPNLSKAFQIWWRRSFLRGSEMHAIESR